MSGSMPEFTLRKVICPLTGPAIKTDAHLPGLLIMRDQLNKNRSKWEQYKVHDEEGMWVDWDHDAAAAEYVEAAGG